jgi:hypothetical protein
MREKVIYLAAAAPKVHGPHIDWSSFSPFVMLTVGALLVLLVGLASGKTTRERFVPLITLLIRSAVRSGGSAIRQRSSPALYGWTISDLRST